MKASMTKISVKVITAVIIFSTSSLSIAEEFTPPFEGASSYHMDYIHPDSFLLYETKSDDLTNAINGELRQGGYVASFLAGGAGIQIGDAIRNNFRVDESGEYEVTFRGSLMGDYWNFSYGTGGNKGALILKLIGGVYTLDNTVETTDVLYDKDLTTAQFVEDLAWAELDAVLLGGKSAIDPDTFEAAKLLSQLHTVAGGIAKPPWDHDSFNISCRLHLDRDTEHRWQIWLDSNMASASAALGCQITALDVTAQLDSVNVQLLSKDPTGLKVEGLTLSPSTVNSQANFVVRGHANYDNGLPVPAGTATITVQGRSTYTTPVTNGQFSREAKTPSNSTCNNITKTVSVVVSDGLFTSDATTATLTIRGQDSSAGFIFNQALMCRDAEVTEPWGYIDPNEIFGDRDDKVTCWIELTDVYGAHTGETRWYRPDNSYWGKGTFTIPDATESGQPYWPSYRIVNQRIDLVTYSGVKNTEGEWKVDIYVDGVRHAILGFCMRYDLTEHRMCKEVDEDDPWMYHHPTNTFYQTDERAFTWCQIVNVAQGLNAKWIAYEPTETPYEEWYYDIIDPVYVGKHYYPSFNLSGYLPVAGTEAAQKCGEWRIEVYIEDLFGNWDLQYTDYFRILENPLERPQISVTANPAAPTAIQTPSFVISAIDNTYLRNVTVYLNIDGELYQETVGTNLNVSSYDYTYSHAPLEEGQRVEYWASAMDTSGNVGESDHRSFLVLPACSNLSVVTESTRVTWTDVTLHGRLIDDEGFPCSCGFAYRVEGSILGYQMPWSYEYDLGEFTSGEEFNVELDLLPYLTYEFAPVAENTAGCIVMGAIDTLRTDIEDPVVVTIRALSEHGTTCLVGFVENDGGNACKCGFLYANIEEPETSWTYIECPGQYRTGDYFVAYIEGLQAYTSYGFYAFAENAAGGWGRGQTVEFVFELPESVYFADVDLENKVRNALGINEPDPIYPSDMLLLNSLTAYSSSISDLTGLEYATNLTYLHLNWNQINSINALFGLTNLTELYLRSNQINDIGALSGLTNLTALYLHDNPLNEDAYPILDLIVINNPGIALIYDPNPNPPSGVSASDGTYTDRVEISWDVHHNGPNYDSYYCVYRSSSEGGEKTAISGWQASTNYNDTTGDAGTTYFYWVKAATDSDGSNPTDYSSYDTGRREITGEAPVISDIPDQTATVGEYFSYHVDASGIPDPTYGLLIYPTGMTINSTIGLIQWTPTETQTGSHPVTVQATNSQGSDAESFTLYVSGVVPVISTISDQIIAVGEPFSYDVEASGIPAPTYSLTTSPSGMTINSANGLIQWTPTESQTGSHPVTVQATNSAGSDTESFSINVSGVSPVITPISDQPATVGEPFSYDVEASGIPAPTYSLTTSPSGMTINSTTGLIQWTPTATQTGSNPVTVLAANSAGSDTEDFTVICSAFVPPTVSVQVTNIQSTSALASITIIDDGGEACEFDFVYDEVGEPGNWYLRFSPFTTGDTFYINLTPLTPDTEYYFKAIGRNSAGEGAWSETNFTTLE